MKKLLILLSSFAGLSIMVGCASTDLEGSAASVVVSPDKPAQGCKYIGQVVGNQGNFFTGEYTSNKNLEQGAMNDLRNQAAKEGANYIQLLTNRAGVTGSGSVYQGTGSFDSEQTNVTVLGNAYNCPQSALGQGAN